MSKIERRPSFLRARLRLATTNPIGQNHCAEVLATYSQILILRGLAIHIDDQTQLNDLELADLMVGDYVDVRGFIDKDGAVVANCLEFEVPRDEADVVK